MVQSMLLNTDNLAPKGREILLLNLGEAYTNLVIPADYAGNPAVLPLLDGLRRDQIILPPIRNDQAAVCALAAIALWHDVLETAHLIVQAMDTNDAALWHGIVHRREGDFSNSGYWFERAGTTSLFAAMGAAASVLINPFPADKTLLRIVRSGYDPVGLVRLVEMVHESPDDPRYALAVSLQQVEWRLLFDACVREARG